MKRFSLTTLFVTAALLCFSQKKNKRAIAISDSTIPVIHIAKEPHFILNLHSGYSVGQGSTFKFYPDDISAITVNINGNNEPQKIVDYANPTKGLGDGFKFGGGVSYILNDFINIGLDFDYFNSTIKKTRDSSFRQINIPFAPNNYDDYAYTERNTISYNATLLTLTPNITFKAIARPKWFLYNKLGAIITFRPNSLQEDATDTKTTVGFEGVYKDSVSRIIKKFEWGIRNPAFGFMGAIGGQVKLSGKVRVFAEVQFTHIVFVIRKRTLTDFIVDKQHIENNFPVNMRVLEFVKSFSSNFNNNNPNKPSQTIIQRIPITYIGVQVGLAFQLK